MRYAIVTQGITHQCVHRVDATDQDGVKARALEIYSDQLSSPPVLMIDFEERTAKRILIDGGTKVILADTAETMFGVNTPQEKMIEEKSNDS